LIGMVFQILLYTVIDPELSEYIVTQTINKTSELYDSLGMPEAQVEEALEEMETDMRAGFTPVGMLKNFALVSIGYAVLSLITGLIVKKNEPIEDY
ncbi:MAG: DUF4199 domain-containing protein, partial [Bacteroidota bacterium]